MGTGLVLGDRQAVDVGWGLGPAASVEGENRGVEEASWGMGA